MFLFSIIAKGSNCAIELNYYFHKCVISYVARPMPGLRGVRVQMTKYRAKKIISQKYRRIYEVNLVKSRDPVNPYAPLIECLAGIL